MSLHDEEWKRRKATERRRKGILPYAASTHFSLAFTGTFFPTFEIAFFEKLRKKPERERHSVVLVLYVEHCFRFEYV